MRHHIDLVLLAMAMDQASVRPDPAFLARLETLLQCFRPPPGAPSTSAGRAPAHLDQLVGPIGGLADDRDAPRRGGVVAGADLLGTWCRGFASIRLNLVVVMANRPHIVQCLRKAHGGTGWLPRQRPRRSARAVSSREASHSSDRVVSPPVCCPTSHTDRQHRTDYLATA
jgi:hypothetical protein